MPGRPAVLYCRWGSASSLDSGWPLFWAVPGSAVGFLQSISDEEDVPLVPCEVEPLQGSSSLLREAVGTATELAWDELSSVEELSSSRLGWCFAPFSAAG